MTKLDNDQLNNIAGGTPGNEDVDTDPSMGDQSAGTKSRDGDSGGGSGGGGGIETPGGSGGIGDTPQNEELG